MSEILNKDGMPCVEEGDNQITSDGLPAESYVTKQTQEDMEKMM